MIDNRSHERRVPGASAHRSVSIIPTISLDFMPLTSLRTASVVALAIGLAACTADSADTAGGSDTAGSREAAGVVNVYSHRHYDSDRELFRRFTDSTGIAVNVVTASADELITRLENEGADSPADVLITVDAGRLHRAKSRELLQP